MANDPVCGMDVDKRKALATSAYRGHTYYFCTKGRKAAFDTDPEKFVGGKQS